MAVCLVGYLLDILLIVTNLVGIERNWLPHYNKIKPWAQDDRLWVIPQQDEYLMGLTLLMFFYLSVMTTTFFLYKTKEIIIDFCPITIENIDIINSFKNLG